MLQSQLPGTNRMHSGGWPVKSSVFAAACGSRRPTLPKCFLGIFPQFGVILKGFVGHNRTQIGAADANVDHLAGVPFQSPLRTRLEKSAIRSSTACTLGTTLSPSTTMEASRGARSAMWRVAPSSDLFASGSESRSYGSISMGERYQHSLRSDWQMTDACARCGEDGISNRRCNRRSCRLTKPN
jgi:hypothetical protein